MNQRGSNREIYMSMNMLLVPFDDYVFHKAVETETLLAFLIIIDDKITHNLWKDVSI